MYDRHGQEELGGYDSNFEEARPRTALYAVVLSTVRANRPRVQMGHRMSNARLVVVN